VTKSANLSTRYSLQPGSGEKGDWLMRIASFRTVVTILGLAFAVACATEPQKPAARSQRVTYLDQINVPLTDAWNAGVRTEIAKLKTATAAVPSEKMTATVLGVVGADGKVQSVRLVKSSGVKIVDQLALRSFQQASPLPAPPPYVVRKGVANVHWDFNLKK
jgi:TonB family protein